MDTPMTSYVTLTITRSTNDHLEARRSLRMDQLGQGGLLSEPHQEAGSAAAPDSQGKNWMVDRPL